jgi:hypothetical protein
MDTQSEETAVAAAGTAYDINDVDEFREQVKIWVESDSRIQYCNQQVKELRDSREKISQSILRIIKKNSMEETVIKLNDGTIKFSSTTSYQSISMGFLKESLIEYLGDAQQAAECIEFLKARREKTVQDVLKRSYT